jgi:hypothetical protein
MLENFLVQRAAESGWVFAKSRDEDIFLFGPDLEDVRRQASIAAELLAHAKKVAAQNVIREALPIDWTPLPLAACA